MIKSILKSSKLRRALYAMSVLFVAVTTVTQMASAAPLSAAQVKVLDEGIYFFNTDLDACGGSDTTDVGASITGNNPRDAYNFFVSNGYSGPGAAGIVGNMMVESTPAIDPTITNASGHYGIVQWSTDRATKMRAFVKAEGKDPTTLDGQLDYVLQELKTSYKSVADVVKVATSPSDAATAFNKGYEVSGDTSGKRESNAEAVYKKYGGDAAASGATDTSSPCSTSNTLSPQCKTATGNAKILCAAEAYEGIYYRLGGGHQAFKTFTAACPDPSNPGTNTPTGGPEGGNPSPCATDCSGLVSVATDTAFGKNYVWLANVDSFSDAWKKISIDSVQAGDTVFRSDGGDEHVEIVDHVTDGKVVTFGSHHTGTKTGFITTPLSYWNAGAMTYQGN